MKFKFFMKMFFIHLGRWLVLINYITPTPGNFKSLEAANAEIGKLKTLIHDLQYRLDNEINNRNIKKKHF